MPKILLVHFFSGHGVFLLLSWKHPTVTGKFDDQVLQYAWNSTPHWRLEAETRCPGIAPRLTHWQQPRSCWRDNCGLHRTDEVTEFDNKWTCAVDTELSVDKAYTDFNTKTPATLSMAASRPIERDVGPTKYVHRQLLQCLKWIKTTHKYYEI